MPVIPIVAFWLKNQLKQKPAGRFAGPAGLIAL
jgi:hypothetical protein